MPMEKKSFLLYYDSYPWTQRLEDVQKGRLFDAVQRYALAVRDSDLTPQQFLEQEGELGMERDTAMAFGFIADTICRDTDKWKRTQAAKEAKARERPSVPAPSREFDLDLPALWRER